MRGFITRSPAWCSDCITEKKPCRHHVGPDGAPVDYVGSDEGPNVYEPSDWVQQVVGHRYRAWGGVYECFGYDPRHGFWMRQVDAPHREANVSERAIGATYHRIFLTPGAWLLARAIKSLGRFPEKDECHGVGIELATGTLRDLGLMVEDQLTPRGLALAAAEDFDLASQVEEAA